MGYSSKGLETDNKVIIAMADLLHGKLERVKYKKGFKASDITSDHGTSRVYSTILFRLMELIVMDVIEGHVVYFDKKIKSRFYVDFKPVSETLIQGKGLKEDSAIVDLRVTQYRMPIIAFDPGYKNSTPCHCFIPNYLYRMLVEKVNSGKKYSKSTKDFWFNKK